MSDSEVFFELWYITPIPFVLMGLFGSNGCRATITFSGKISFPTM